ncbi:class I SAM-dependent methyltransferase [Micromonospora echinofusca]|uniref:class I SAM-dependent methyltransferase n=1 Tax=Micromonospora echinofusca TaxID=47858 RepID=UPI00202234C7|nr:class I SAM-dependent methyltransferase [Micromonospora sp. MSM11]MCL7460886.1 class I SAM-dependent methyltransferase [Micromonospora sp. MSM11]
MTAPDVEAAPQPLVDVDQERHARFRTSFEAVTDFGRRLLAARLAAAGVLPAAGSTAGRDEILARLAVAAGYQRLGDALLDLLERADLLRRQGDRLAVTHRVAEAAGLADDDAVDAAATALRREHPEAAGYVPLLVACQTQLVGVVRGDRPANEVLFPGGSAELVSAIYRDNVQLDFHNRLCAALVQQHVRQFLRRYPRSFAQVMEVGAGTGGTSGPVLDALADRAERLRYSYTDVGPAFLRLGRQRFGADRPYVDFARYNVEGAPEDQGFEPGSMQVVLASNVLHATLRISAALRHCHALLKPGGVLVVNEMTSRLDYNTLTFGLAEGWWRHADDEPRVPASPLLDVAGWRAALGRAGFVDVRAYSVPGLADGEQVQTVFVATATGACGASG